MSWMERGGMQSEREGDLLYPRPSFVAFTTIGGIVDNWTPGSLTTLIAVNEDSFHTSHGTPSSSLIEASALTLSCDPIAVRTFHLSREIRHAASAVRHWPHVPVHPVFVPLEKLRSCCRLCCLSCWKGRTGEAHRYQVIVTTEKKRKRRRSLLG